MIYVICSGSRVQAGTILTSALQRSCGRTQVQQVTMAHLPQWFGRSDRACLVFIDPPEQWSSLIERAVSAHYAKVMLFGTIPQSLAPQLGAVVGPLSDEIEESAVCSPAPEFSFSESSLHIEYHSGIAGLDSPLTFRPLVRYDFMDEWNNLGFGAILVDDSIWALSQEVQLPMPSRLASLVSGERTISAYAGLWDSPTASLLWFNRPVGPVDSQEWRLVESFLAHYRHSELPCWPILSEIPHGFDAAVTMHLDCDEDVESARHLWTVYQSMGIPFSLALHTGILSDPRHHILPRDVLVRGGALLSHSATHAPNWGGSYEAALNEGTLSAAVIKDLTGHVVRYAVSPFHQTPDYARLALADAGYGGCIGGIIHNDPDFLMARAGSVPGMGIGFIGHSQQCMLHGSCLSMAGDPLASYKQAFDQARVGRSFFGYLDHPFSRRYQYGWTSETQRAEMHKDLLSYMGRGGSTLFCNQDEAMEFLSFKSYIAVSSHTDGYRITVPYSQTAKWDVVVEYRGCDYHLGEGGLLL